MGSFGNPGFQQPELGPPSPSNDSSREGDRKDQVRARKELFLRTVCHRVARPPRWQDLHWPKVLPLRMMLVRRYITGAGSGRPHPVNVALRGKSGEGIYRGVGTRNRLRLWDQPRSRQGSHLFLCSKSGGRYGRQRLARPQGYRIDGLLKVQIEELPVR